MNGYFLLRLLFGFLIGFFGIECITGNYTFQGYPEISIFITAFSVIMVVMLGWFEYKYDTSSRDGPESYTRTT